MSVALIEALLDRYQAAGFTLRNNSDKSLSVIPTFRVTPKTTLPVEGQQYLIVDEPFLDCSLNIFVSGLRGGFAVDSSNRGLIARTPVAPITNAAKMPGTTIFMRHGIWLIGIGYDLDRRMATQRDIGNMNKTFKVKRRGDLLYIERKIEHDDPQHALRYAILIDSNSSLLIKELPTPHLIVAGRWLKRNAGNILSLVKLAEGG
jgi:hypothetical protein